MAVRAVQLSQINPAARSLVTIDLAGLIAFRFARPHVQRTVVDTQRKTEDRSTWPAFVPPLWLGSRIDPELQLPPVGLTAGAPGVVPQAHLEALTGRGIPQADEIAQIVPQILVRVQRQAHGEVVRPEIDIARPVTDW